MTNSRLNELYNHEKDVGFYLINPEYTLEYFLNSLCSPTDKIMKEECLEGVIYRNYSKNLVYIQEDLEVKI